MRPSGAIAEPKRPSRASNVRLLLILATVGAMFILLSSAERRYRPSDATRTTLLSARTGLKLYREEHGAYPTTAQGLRALAEAGLLDRAPTDAWGRALVYRSDGVEFELFSLGADGAPGGVGENADLAARDLN